MELTTDTLRYTASVLFVVSFILFILAILDGLVKWIVTGPKEPGKRVACGLLGVVFLGLGVWALLLASPPRAVKSPAIQERPIPPPARESLQPETKVPAAPQEPPPLPPAEGKIPGRIEITSHRPGEVVPWENRFSGTYSGLPKESDIWVLLYPPNRRYYPQSDDAAQGLPAAKSAGEWSAQVYVGKSPGEDVGKIFDVIVVAATPSASAFFAEKMRKWAEAERWPGLSKGELPAGITEKAKVTVKRGP